MSGGKRSAWISLNIYPSPPKKNSKKPSTLFQKKIDHLFRPQHLPQLCIVFSQYLETCTPSWQIVTRDIFSLKSWRLPSCHCHRGVSGIPLTNLLPWRWPLPNGMVPVPYSVSRSSWELQKSPKPPSPQPSNPWDSRRAVLSFSKPAWISADSWPISCWETYYVETLSGESFIVMKGGFSKHLKQKGISQTQVNKSDICNNVVSFRFM